MGQQPAGLNWNRELTLEGGDLGGPLGIDLRRRLDLQPKDARFSLEVKIALAIDAQSPAETPPPLGFLAVDPQEPRSGNGLEISSPVFPSRNDNVLASYPVDAAPSLPSLDGHNNHAQYSPRDGFASDSEEHPRIRGTDDVEMGNESPSPELQHPERQLAPAEQQPVGHSSAMDDHSIARMLLKKNPVPQDLDLSFDPLKHSHEIRFKTMPEGRWKSYVRGGWAAVEDPTAHVEFICTYVGCSMDSWSLPMLAPYGDETLEYTATTLWNHFRNGCHDPKQQPDIAKGNVRRSQKRRKLSSIDPAHPPAAGSTPQPFPPPPDHFDAAAHISSTAAAAAAPVTALQFGLASAVAAADHQATGASGVEDGFAASAPPDLAAAAAVVHSVHSIQPPLVRPSASSPGSCVVRVSRGLEYEMEEDFTLVHLLHKFRSMTMARPDVNITTWNDLTGVSIHTILAGIHFWRWSATSDERERIGPVLLQALEELATSRHIDDGYDLETYESLLQEFLRRDALVPQWLLAVMCSSATNSLIAWDTIRIGLDAEHVGAVEASQNATSFWALGLSKALECQLLAPTDEEVDPQIFTVMCHLVHRVPQKDLFDFLLALRTRPFRRLKKLCKTWADESLREPELLLDMLERAQRLHLKAPLLARVVEEWTPLPTGLCSLVASFLVCESAPRSLPRPAQSHRSLADSALYS